jgi:hypothetical protein
MSPLLLNLSARATVAPAVRPQGRPNGILAVVARLAR